MNAPVFAAFAPGVDVSGRMVSAISSSSAMSAAVNVPVPCAIASSLATSSNENASRRSPPTSAAPPSSAVTR